MKYTVYEGVQRARALVDGARICYSKADDDAVERVDGDDSRQSEISNALSACVQALQHADEAKSTKARLTWLRSMDEPFDVDVECDGSEDDLVPTEAVKVAVQILDAVTDVTRAAVDALDDEQDEDDDEDEDEDEMSEAEASTPDAVGMSDAEIGELASRCSTAMETAEYVVVAAPPETKVDTSACWSDKDAIDAHDALIEAYDTLNQMDEVFVRECDLP